MKYTQLLLDSFYESTHSGVIQGADLTYKAEDKSTGDAVKFYFLVDGNAIKDVRFQACGSIVLFASLSAIASLAKDKTIDDCFLINEKQIIKEIKQVNRCDYSVVCFAVSAFNGALNLLLKRLDKIKENKGLKKVKVKKLLTSSNISIFGENTEVEETMVKEPVKEEPLKEESKEIGTKVDEVTIEEGATAKETPIVVEIEKEPITSIEEISALEDPIMAEEEEDFIIRKEILESIPTKIEVRVLENEDEDEEDVNTLAIIDDQVDDQEENIETKLETLPEVKTIEIKDKKEENSSNAVDDDMLDEIDSITAKLTDAITKLNFKFDVDEDNV